ncbi:hypothetical protein DEM27_23780 [Metarhizobium album]|uniref:Uncharacterized protein n=1 Tax=Metarhizobium album TaxID=2182425 RepID=A0A2U2DKV1_9HYPH|nr:hypothetical protein [Rhizobium album]PWE53935.1 hypothetical protein DEM27_23780 [Rhizobium album]
MDHLELERKREEYQADIERLTQELKALHDAGSVSPFPAADVTTEFSGLIATLEDAVKAFRKAINIIEEKLADKTTKQNSSSKR